MIVERPIHPDFQYYLDFKSGELITLFQRLRALMFELAPACNEILYHTHALTSVYSHSEKLSDAFCHIPIYNEHLNLGFNKGTLLQDPRQLLHGTGKLIRHVQITSMEDINKVELVELINNAIKFAQEDMKGKPKSTHSTISKIKR